MVYRWLLRVLKGPLHWPLRVLRRPFRIQKGPTQGPLRVLYRPLHSCAAKVFAVVIGVAWGPPLVLLLCAAAATNKPFAKRSRKTDN